MINRLVVVIVQVVLVMGYSWTARAQDPPARKTNQSNEAAEPPALPMRSGPLGSGAGSMKKTATPVGPVNLYGLVDLRHTTSDYFGPSGERVRRDPALHAKMRVGSRFYGDGLDVSAGVGASKLPGSQRVYQNRPDLTVDMYPVRSHFFNLLVYGSSFFAVRSVDLDPTEFSDGDRYDRDYRRAIDTTVFNFGVAPNARVEWPWALGRTSLTVGADIWTRLYSKPLFVDNSSTSVSLGLVPDKHPPSRPIEDRALRYAHQEMLGLGYSPNDFPKLQGEYAVYYESRYLPRYFQNDQNGSWEYTYQSERVSFARFKLSYDLTTNTTLSDELYFFRNGFFAEDRINDERRFKNIARIAFKL